MSVPKFNLLDWLVCGAIAAACGLAFQVVRLCDSIKKEKTEFPMGEYRHSHKGKASWFNTKKPMTAACRIYAKGTRVLVKYHGLHAVVTVTSSGPSLRYFHAGRIIDLPKDAFSALASPCKGVIDVEIEQGR